MGIDTGSSLVVGLPYPELKPVIDKLGKDDVYADDLDLSYVSPYYDSDREHQVWGVHIAGRDWEPVEIDIEKLPSLIADALAKFEKATGLKGRLYVSPHVT